MAFSAGVYEATWKFKEQGLPYDLEARQATSVPPSLSCLPTTAGLCITLEAWNSLEMDQRLSIMGKYLLWAF